MTRKETRKMVKLSQISRKITSPKIGLMPLRTLNNTNNNSSSNQDMEGKILVTRPKISTKKEEASRNPSISPETASISTKITTRQINPSIGSNKLSLKLRKPGKTSPVRNRNNKKKKNTMTTGTLGENKPSQRITLPSRNRETSTQSPENFPHRVNH